MSEEDKDNFDNKVDEDKIEKKELSECITQINELRQFSKPLYLGGGINIENIKEITIKDKKNIKKKTLESEEFYVLVKNKIKKTSAILKITNQ